MSNLRELTNAELDLVSGGAEAVFKTAPTRSSGFTPSSRLSKTSFVSLKASKDVIPGAKSPHTKSPHRNATLLLVTAGPVSKGRPRIFITAHDCRPREASTV
jgi:hypothetical protein